MSLLKGVLGFCSCFRFLYKETTCNVQGSYHKTLNLLIIFNSDAGIIQVTCDVLLSGISKATLYESTFTETGFTSWQDATRAFRKHEASDHHRGAVRAVLTKQRQQSGVEPRVDVLLDSTKKQALARTNIMLVKVVGCLQFLARQGLALRGGTALMQGESGTFPGGDSVFERLIMYTYLVLTPCELTLLTNTQLLASCALNSNVKIAKA